MNKQDPVLEALKQLEEAIPQALKPLITAYENGGISALNDAWRQIIKQAIDENK